MLVLSRTRDERIVIDDTIVVTVTDIRGDKVRIGIDAPADVPIYRWELWQQIRQANGNKDLPRNRTLKDFASYGSPAAAQAHLERVLQDLGWPSDTPIPVVDGVEMPIEASHAAAE